MNSGVKKPSRLTEPGGRVSRIDPFASRYGFSPFPPLADCYPKTTQCRFWSNRSPSAKDPKGCACETPTPKGDRIFPVENAEAKILHVKLTPAFNTHTSLPLATAAECETNANLSLGRYKAFRCTTLSSRAKVSNFGSSAKDCEGGGGSCCGERSSGRLPTHSNGCDRPGAL